jgi:hypothetical protein
MVIEEDLKFQNIKVIPGIPREVDATMGGAKLSLGNTGGRGERSSAASGLFIGIDDFLINNLSGAGGERIVKSSADG